MLLTNIPVHTPTQNNTIDFCDPRVSQQQYDILLEKEREKALTDSEYIAFLESTLLTLWTVIHNYNTTQLHT
jgi:hypothetical protein